MISYIDNTYVLHVKEGYQEREESIIKQLKELDIPFIWILDHDIPDLKKERTDIYFKESHSLRDSELSVSMKHIEALKKMIENNDKIALILEDDVIFSENSIEILNKIYPEIEALGDDFIISLGNANSMYTSKERLLDKQYLYLNTENRAADSFLISNSAAKKRLDYLEKYKTILPADHMYNFLDLEVENSIYWLEPTIVVQGSQAGLFESSIQKKKQFHRLRWLWRDFRKKYLSR